MTRPTVLHAVFVGEAITLATVGVVAGTAIDQSRSLPFRFLAAGLAVGVPFSLPWLALWGLERAPRSRTLGVFEGGFYGLLALCELGLLFYLPGALRSSEGFFMLAVWALGPVAMILLVFVNQFWRPAP
jgi:hypothetical protein